MKNLLIAAMAAAVIVFASGGHSQEAGKKSGEALFKQFCISCHPDGKNILNPKKSLFKKDMESNKVKTAEDIIKLMRNPGPGMIKYDEKTISEKDGKAIAEYILKTFK